MRKKSLGFIIVSVALAVGGIQQVSAQPTAADPADTDPAAVAVPSLAFKPDAEAIKNFDKYFYFHREDTDYVTALADIPECDGYARGLSYHAGNVPVGYPYAGTIGGAIGGAIGNALADAIYGSAMRRQQRRVNMRTCMGYKEYKAYGLPKEIWVKFNFEEGLTAVEEDKRQAFLRQQAKVASGPKPDQEEITQWTN
ncbi:MAG: hypothetical protein M3Q08_05170 [Pseudomonadota bacterium]|nr:hypothetical protein [Pseudomonadota bacterium]